MVRELYIRTMGSRGLSPHARSLGRVCRKLVPLIGGGCIYNVSLAHFLGVFYTFFVWYELYFSLYPIISLIYFMPSPTIRTLPLEPVVWDGRQQIYIIYARSNGSKAYKLKVSVAEWKWKITIVMGFRPFDKEPKVLRARQLLESLWV